MHNRHTPHLSAGAMPWTFSRVHDPRRSHGCRISIRISRSEKGRGVREPFGRRCLARAKNQWQSHRQDCPEHERKTPKAQTASGRAEARPAIQIRLREVFVEAPAGSCRPKSPANENGLKALPGNCLTLRRRQNAARCIRQHSSRCRPYRVTRSGGHRCILHHAGRPRHDVRRLRCGCRDDDAALPRNP